MPQGLQVWDPAGNLIFDTNDRIGRVLGAVQTGTSAGDVVNAGLATGTPFVIVQKIGAIADAFKIPTVSISGTTLSWTAGPHGLVNHMIIYGVR